MIESYDEYLIRCFRECHRGSEKEFEEKIKIIEELKLEAKLELQEAIQNRIERIKNM